MSDSPRHLREWLMVGLQGLLFLAVAVTAIAPVPGGSWPSSLWGGLALIVAGSLGVLWTGRLLGRSLTPLPAPNGEGLVVDGAYRWARHPMYSALVVICLGVAVSSGAWTSYTAVAALTVFFMVKSRMEERFLLQAYEGYRDYASRTGRFLPGVGRL
ncbi:isoprenylcysteine carboxylmethyltransferase family protein [Demequina sp. B12]|uniref:methyltransferase family protein n=1 Tax=Demequina sp. B12 TaxID=2992757 RepID=UPI00237BD2C7|nr:isoprenylcysteine carboxylmethyltransferase family protein [Demequina sp. B12]MDE0573451.1 isoprenylcysteine carboxylmethyltransferase family protein [Demequina sp. B12]